MSTQEIVLRSSKFANSISSLHDSYITSSYRSFATELKFAPTSDNETEATWIAMFETSRPGECKEDGDHERKLLHILFFPFFPSYSKSKRKTNHSEQFQKKLAFTPYWFVLKPTMVTTGSIKAKKIMHSIRVHDSICNITHVHTIVEACSLTHSLSFI